MKDIKIEFLGQQSSINLNSLVDGKGAYVQKCAVNMAQEVGSDPTYPDKGTDLLKEVIESGVDERAAQHSVNFATNSTLYFVRQTDTDKTTQDRAIRISGEIPQLTYNALIVNLNFTFADGVTLEVFNPIAL